jgi:hypothetical protein
MTMPKRVITMAETRTLAHANGVPMPDQPLLPGGLYLVPADDGGRRREGLVVQTYVPRSRPSSN